MSTNKHCTYFTTINSSQYAHLARSCSARGFVTNKTGSEVRSLYSVGTSVSVQPRKSTATWGAWCRSRTIYEYGALVLCSGAKKG